MRWIFLCSLALAACDSPSVSVTGQAPVQIAAGGHVFSVRVRDSYAESIRTDAAWPPPKSAEIVPLAIEAMERVSGCTVRKASVRGDAAIQKARLSC